MVKVLPILVKTTSVLSVPQEERGREHDRMPRCNAQAQMEAPHHLCGPRRHQDKPEGGRQGSEP